MLVLLSGALFAQVPDSLVTKLHRVAFTSGFTGADSLLSYGVVDITDSTTALHYSDSLRYVDFRYNFEQIYITVTDTGTTVTDSLLLYKGRPRMDDNGIVIDTVWDSSPLPVKSNLTFTDANYLVGAGLTKTYTLLDWSIGLLKIIRVNATVTAKNVVHILIEAVKK